MTATRTLFVLVAFLAIWMLDPEAADARRKCGDQNGNGTVTAPDALAILKVSVGLMQCDFCVCDTNGSYRITAADALMVLQFAVGQPVTLGCQPCILCGQTSTPQCGGDCAAGQHCVPDPWDADGAACECMTECELSSAPACGGGCEGSPRANDVCTHVTIESGSETLEICECLLPGAKACADTATPACGGICATGHRCVEQSGKCKCVAQPVQGPCSKAHVPACAGYCGADSICQQSGDTCVCGPQTGDSPCYEASDPQCGAPCANGNRCAAGIIFGCDCVSLCELSDAPGCGGACLEPGSECVASTATVGDSTIAFCECR